MLSQNIGHEQLGKTFPSWPEISKTHIATSFIAYGTNALMIVQDLCTKEFMWTAVTASPFERDAAAIFQMAEPELSLARSDNEIQHRACSPCRSFVFASNW